MSEIKIDSRDLIRSSLKEGIAPGKLDALLDTLDSADLLHAVYRLSPDEQRKLLSEVSTERAADIVEELPDGHAAELMEEMSAQESAVILEELASDHRVDILSELDSDDTEAILEQMDDEDVEEIRQLISYPPDVAGGLMMTEFATYPRNASVREVVEDLTGHEGDYEFLTVHYIYVVVRRHALVGVIRLRDLVFADPEVKIGTLAKQAKSVAPDASLLELDQFFADYDIAAVPVVNEKNHLLGIVRRRSLLEALAEKSESDNLKAAGIVSGDELRSMPVLVRAKRRLSWLSINIGLNIVAASVIAVYEDTLSAVIALAVFLPIVSDMSGCSGNQAVAVSMRELTLGAAEPKDVARVWGKELIVGLINGIALGLLLGLAAWAWKGNALLGAVVGGALALNTVLAVSIGGTVPLILKRLNVDPAVASGPLLTTITDMCGFFLVLSLASLVLPSLI
ncbi:MAG: magnesium transporter [Xanthomonadales bacterium]|nr:magnesium transporter [Gammaproteobacteria bacterium]MBT8054026.1 magnesium transporter [Gammaproteobacteria bacterium]NND56964.1 magnesium transporter [Xanthomonadales bacterium]NNK51922.1 magnesium transporter [Xanthomonadales bacterium]